MIKTTDVYAIYAYEMGFDHARSGAPAPCRYQCNHYYWLGYTAALNS